MKLMYNGNERSAVSNGPTANNSRLKTCFNAVGTWLKAQGPRFTALVFASFLPLVSCGGPEPSEGINGGENSQTNEEKPANNCRRVDVAEETQLIVLNGMGSYFVNERSGVARLTVEVLEIGRLLDFAHDPKNLTVTAILHLRGYSVAGRLLHEVGENDLQSDADIAGGIGHASGNIANIDLSEVPSPARAGYEDAKVVLMDTRVDADGYYNAAELKATHRKSVDCPEYVPTEPSSGDSNEQSE